ncbi:hypothetical protein [Clostridium transplantifaecale]|uniref:hypothetical protein n=1 Tax=Clostridium transplantifaecale TaxID=2479838 RepID=UPI000F63F991|nr:hypothetical protein [Clostridium transplantifaecale]
MRIKKSIRIKTVSQWYLLKQMNNDNFFGKRKIPEEVINQIFRMLYSKQLGRDGYIILCFSKVADDLMGIEDIVGLYPYRLWLDEDMDEIETRTKKGKIKHWYIAHVRVRGQRAKIAVIYTSTKHE